jgi:pimeloyl-ACP methyl ester carboxylesterase
VGLRTIALALIGLSCISVQPLRGQTMSTAVLADPPVDKQYPPGLAMFTVPSHGTDLDAWLYVASGVGPHGTVILAHGLPGYEMSGDLAQSIRRAGWNVLLFHYRGTWGVSGAFSQASAIEDTAEVVRFLREPANVAKYRIDPKRLVIIGHSFGGFIAGYEAAHDPDIRAVAMIAAVNLGKINADPREREARLKRWESQLHPVRGATAQGLFAEAERHATDWDYAQWAEALRARPVLLVEADDQNHADMEALGAALRQKGAVALEQTAVATDHSFSGRRIELQTIVIRWLERLSANIPDSASAQQQHGSADASKCIARAALDREAFESVMETVADRWNHGDATGAASCFAENAIYSGPPSPPHRGRRALYEFFGGAKGRELPMHMTWHYLIFDPAQQIGVGEYTFQYRIQTHGLVIVRISNGLILNWREYEVVSILPWEQFVGDNRF